MLGDDAGEWPDIQMYVTHLLLSFTFVFYVFLIPTIFSNGITIHINVIFSPADV